jgi:hypothetical protein
VTQLGQLEDWYIFNGPIPASSSPMLKMRRRREEGLPDYP